MSSPKEQSQYGSTGDVSKDGFLNPEERSILDTIQQDAAGTIFERLETRESTDPFPMVAMATGIGKGNIIHRVIEMQMRTKPDSRVLVIAGTKKVLVNQTHEALAGYRVGSPNPQGESYIDLDEIDEDSIEESDNGQLSLDDSSLYRTGTLLQADTNVNVGTIQAVQTGMRRGLLRPDDFDLVIVDEVHNIGTPARRNTIDQFTAVAGFTATPRRHSGYMKEPADYGFEVVYTLPLLEAQDLHLLPPLVGMQIDTKTLVDKIPTTSAGKIDFKELEQLLKGHPELRAFIADRVVGIISGDNYQLKTVIAVNFVWEAIELAKLLKNRGLTVGVAVNQRAATEIDSEDIPAVDSIERYKLPDRDERSIQVLISPYVAAEGFDAPVTEALVWASPTDSSLRYTQYTGRLARRAPGKRFGIVVDCLYQTSQFGWSYNFGMWMKGNVKQLDNGLLWLGPEIDIEEARMLPVLDNITRQNYKQELSELARSREDYIPVTAKILAHEFNIPSTSLVRIIHDLRSRYPDEIIPVKSQPFLMTERIIAQLRSELQARQSAGLMLLPMAELVADFGVQTNAILSQIRRLAQSHPDYFQIGKPGRAYKATAAGIGLLIGELKALSIPDEFTLVPGFSEELYRISKKYYEKLFFNFVKKHPDHFKKAGLLRGKPYFASEEGIRLLEEHLSEYKKAQ